MEFIGRHYITGKPVRIRVEGEFIRQIEPASETPSLWIAPALIDLQINGFAGCNINGPTASPESVATIVEKQWALGIGAICPTVTTHAQERMLYSLLAISEACTDPRIARSVLGIHIEGPWLSPEDGPRGAHAREHVRPPDWEEFEAWQEAAEGRIRLVTLAPEIQGAIPMTKRLTDGGIVVAIGHTNPRAEDIDAAIQAGARLSTHLGNGAHATLPRHPNYLWEQLARDELMASLIVDGHHLPPSVVKCMFRCKGLERVLLISDAVTFAGLPPGRYETEDRAVEVNAAGRVSLAGTPYLAGAGLDLMRCVLNATRFADISLSQAIELATLRPAQLLGLQDRMGSLDEGKRADLILFEQHDDRVEIHQTVVAGEAVYTRQESSDSE